MHHLLKVHAPPVRHQADKPQNAPTDNWSREAKRHLIDILHSGPSYVINTLLWSKLLWTLLWSKTNPGSQPRLKTLETRRWEPANITFITKGFFCQQFFNLWTDCTQYLSFTERVITPVHLTNQSFSLRKLGIWILFEYIVTVCFLYPMFYIDKWLGLG